MLDAVPDARRALSAESAAAATLARILQTAQLRSLSDGGEIYLASEAQVSPTL
jgi:hypothetical protein